MSRVVKAVTSVGSAALLLSGAAMAAPPAFSEWTVSSGNISSTASGGTGTNCPTGYTCGPALTGAGFYQRQVSDGTNIYFQTIITETYESVSTTGTIDDLAFYDESFVLAKFGAGSANGIADKQHILQNSATEFARTGVPNSYTDSFLMETNINAGWAGDNMNIKQVLVDTANQGFRTDFFFNSQNLTAVTNNQPDNMWMKISAKVGLTGTNLNGEVQDFVMAEARGSFVPSNGTIDASAFSGWKSKADPNTTLNTISYSAGGDVGGVWVGQNMPSIGQNFSFESYEDLSTAQDDGMFKFGLDITAVSAAEAWDTTLLGSVAADGTGYSGGSDFKP